MELFVVFLGILFFYKIIELVAEIIGFFILRPINFILQLIKKSFGRDRKSD